MKMLAEPISHHALIERLPFGHAEVASHVAGRAQANEVHAVVVASVVVDVMDVQRAGAGLLDAASLAGEAVPLPNLAAQRLIELRRIHNSGPHMGGTKFRDTGGAVDTIVSAHDETTRFRHRRVASRTRDRDRSVVSIVGTAPGPSFGRPFPGAGCITKVVGNAPAQFPLSALDCGPTEVARKSFACVGLQARVMSTNKASRSSSRIRGYKRSASALARSASQRIHRTSVPPTWLGPHWNGGDRGCRPNSLSSLATECPSTSTLGRSALGIAQSATLLCWPGPRVANRKTSFGPHWLFRELVKCGPGDYLVVTPTFPLLEVKALPEFRRLFETQLKLGTYRSSPVRQFTLSEAGERRLWGDKQDVPTNVYFGYAADPESLESMTAKAAWLDEAGQKTFKRGSWEAIQRRLSIHQGRALITTTPYDLGWLKQTFYDPWIAANRDHPTIDVINFPSTANPKFPADELERARLDLPGWKYRMFYLGEFERPAGLIYDCFDPATHVVDDFTIPAEWPRYQGTDFGGVNTAGVWIAQDPKTKRNYIYAEYLHGGRTARQHAVTWEAKHGRPLRVVGGSHSEGQWRQEFRQAGYPIHEPDVKEVEVGINRVYGAIKRNELFVFKSCAGTIDQLNTYSRVLDANGDPTEAIEDKATYHYADALRYVCGWLYRTPRKPEIL